MRNRRFEGLYVVIALFASFFPAPAWAELILNGSFEDPPILGGYQYVPGGMTAISGWQTLLSGVERFNPNIYSAGAAQDGSLVLDLNTDYAVGGGIQQTFATTPGDSYTLSFFAGTWQAFGRDGTGHIEVSIDGVGQTFTVTNPTNTIVWTLFSVTFQATAPNTIIALRNFDSPSQTFSLIDNVSVTPVLDSDGDGVPDDEDACIDSTLSTSVVIDNCDSGVGNQLFDDGCTITDLIAECAKGASNHGQFVSCVSHLTNDLKKAGAITGQQKGAIQSCAAQADIR